jgi:hypothetical protein
LKELLLLLLHLQTFAHGGDSIEAMAEDRREEREG